MIDPWADWVVTCDWLCHERAHVSDLGTDLAASVGTPIIAPCDGELVNVVRRETPNLYIAYLIIKGHPNAKFEFMHLSRFARAGEYKEGAVIGWTGGAVGAVGSGHASGPHLHINGVVDGHVVPYQNLFSEFASTGNVTPITQGRNPMTTVYYTTIPTPVPATFSGWRAGNLYSQAGDGSGAAAWLETQDGTLASNLTAFHGISQNAVPLSNDTYLSWRTKYLSAQPVSGVTAGGAAGASKADVQAISDASDANIQKSIVTAEGAIVAKIPTKGNISLSA